MPATNHFTVAFEACPTGGNACLVLVNWIKNPFLGRPRWNPIIPVWLNRRVIKLPSNHLGLY